MYDILQLNDMLVPELLDIAEQKNISNAKTLDKQDLIYQILDKQTLMNNTEDNAEKKAAIGDKPRRKRIVKPAVTTEPAKDEPAEDEEVITQIAKKN